MVEKPTKPVEKSNKNIEDTTMKVVKNNFKKIAILQHKVELPEDFRGGLIKCYKDAMAEKPTEPSVHKAVEKRLKTILKASTK